MGPVALGIGLGLQTIGTLGSAFSNANMQEQEAALKDLQAREVQIKAVRDEMLLRKRGAEFMGNQTAAAAASGSGSAPLLQLVDTANAIEEESLAIKHAAEFRESQLRESAFSQRWAAQGSRIGGLFGGFGGILTGAAQFEALRDPNMFGKANA